MLEWLFGRKEDGSINLEKALDVVLATKKQMRDCETTPVVTPLMDNEHRCSVYVKCGIRADQIYPCSCLETRCDGVPYCIKDEAEKCCRD